MTIDQTNPTLIEMKVPAIVMNQSTYDELEAENEEFRRLFLSKETL